MIKFFISIFLFFSVITYSIADSLKVETVFPDPDAKYPATLLYAGSFHRDEVPAKATKMKWNGIFFEENNYYLDAAKLQSEKEYDPILDDNESVKTGIKITVQNKKNTLLLISGIKLKKNNKIQKADFSLNDPLFPGKEINFSFNETSYRFFATGNGDSIETIENYRMYLQTGEKTQLICAQPYLDGNMPSVVFVGDIDQDKIPDLIINNSHHYNVGRLTLYLSSFAGKEEIVKVMGMLTKTGC